jgi:hypothetical protein
MSNKILVKIVQTDEESPLGDILERQEWVERGGGGNRIRQELERLSLGIIWETGRNNNKNI